MNDDVKALIAERLECSQYALDRALHWVKEARADLERAEAKVRECEADVTKWRRSLEGL